MSGLVIGVSVFILFSLSTVWLADIIPYLDFFVLSLFGTLSLFAFHFVVLMIALSFYLSIVTPPGSVPWGWTPSDATQKELELAIEEANRRGSVRGVTATGVRYCLKCKQFRPPRCHHCVECDRCFLRLDHHCPWINNCVGLQNHKYFVQFVVYAAIGCSWVLVMHILTIYDVVVHFIRVEVVYGTLSYEVIARVFLVMDTIFLMPITLGLICLATWQVRLVLENVTSMENREREWAKKKAGENSAYVWKYDFGFVQNLNNFLGPSYFDWFFPSPPPWVNGLEYRVNSSWTPPPSPVVTHEKSSQSVKIQIDSDDDYEPRKVGFTKVN